MLAATHLRNISLDVFPITPKDGFDLYFFATFLYFVLCFTARYLQARIQQVSTSSVNYCVNVSKLLPEQKEEMLWGSDLTQAHEKGSKATELE